MKKLTPMQWMAALLVSLLITGSLVSLAMTYFLYLPMLSGFVVHKEDRWAIEQSSIIATNAFFGALTCGLLLGICLPAACRWAKRRRELLGASNAEPGTSPNGGPATPVGNSGVPGGPPSVS